MVNVEVIHIVNEPTAVNNIKLEAGPVQLVPDY